MPALTLSDVWASRGGNPALCGVSAQFISGEVTLVAGANGSGKSTLVGVLAGVIPVERGRVEPVRRNIALVGQGVRASAQVPVTVHAAVSMGRWREKPWWRGLDREDRRIVDEAIARLGLDELKSRPLETLSGGQFQRVLIARALAQQADALLLDEAATALDGQAAESLDSIAREQAREGRTVVVVSHDERDIARADRLIRLDAGRVVATAADAV